MKRLTLLSVFVAGAVALFVSPATTASAKQADEKVVICHHNLDDPTEPEFVTITVAESAVPAHLAHGDVLGACAVE